MSEPIVFISHFRVKEGALDNVKQLIQKVGEQIKANRPGTVVFLQYLNEAGTELSFVHMFPDSESFDQHVVGADERSNAAFEFVVPTRREVYGTPSARVAAMLRPPDGSAIAFQIMPQLAGGYIRTGQG